MNPLTEICDKFPLLDDVLRLQRAVDRESMSASTLPPDLGDPAARNLEQATGGLIVRIAAEVSDQRRNILLIDGFNIRRSTDQMNKHRY